MAPIRKCRIKSARFTPYKKSNSLISNLTTFIIHLNSMKNLALNYLH